MSRSRDQCVHSVSFVVNRMLSLVLSQLYAAFGFGIGSAVANVVRPFFLLALATPNYCSCLVRSKAAETVFGDLRKYWLPTLDPLRNFFLPTAARLIVVQMVRDTSASEYQSCLYGVRHEETSSLRDRSSGLFSP